MIRQYTWLLGLALTSSVFGEPSKAAQKWVKLEPVKPVSLSAGETTEMVVKFSIHEGFHVQANPASQPNNIPTTLTITKVDGIQVGEPAYPPGKPYRQAGSDRDLSTYEGAVEIPVTLTADAAAKAGKASLKSKLRFQACDSKVCFFPTSIDFEVPVKVVKAK